MVLSRVLPMFGHSAPGAGGARGRDVERWTTSAAHAGSSREQPRGGVRIARALWLGAITESKAALDVRPELQMDL